MKLRNKLILSCAALAAVATTAVSTTYAWYTSNKEVTADGITAKTASNGDDLLLISRTGVQNSWSASVDLSDIKVNFVPVTKKNDGKFYAWDATNNAPTTSETQAGFITFDLYFKSGNSSDLTVQFKTFTLANNTGETLPAKSALSQDGLGNVGSDYTVDLLRALTMEITESKGLEGVSSAQAADEPNAVNTAYQFNGLAANDSFAAQGYSYDYNAHTYYNAVKGLAYQRATTVTAENFATLKATLYTVNNQGVYSKLANDATFDENASYYTKDGGIVSANDGSPETRHATLGEDEEDAFASSRTELYAASNAIVNKSTGACTNWVFTNKTGSGDADATIAAENEATTGVSILKVHFEIYLDGWDKACFDAVQGQNISLGMVFETKTTQNQG